MILQSTNQSLSAEAGVLRGLHFQRAKAAQTKLIRVVTGAVLDVIVDVRAGSPTYGEWEGYIISESNHRQLLVPRGFAHGFVTLTGLKSIFETDFKRHSEPRLPSTAQINH